MPLTLPTLALPRHWRLRLPTLVLALLLGVLSYELLLAGRLAQLRAALAHVPATRIGVCDCDPDTTLVLSRPDGLHLAASLYGTGDDRPRPAILLLHGLTPLGRELPLYRVLARHLADRGYVVMTVDFTGYGKSDDPLASGVPEVMGSDGDVRAALRALRAHPAVSPAPIALIGHSMGAIEALSVGRTDPDVGRVVAFGPPRRTGQVLATEQGRAYHWERIRRTYDSVYHHAMPAWYTEDAFFADKSQRDIERLLPDWQTPDRRPLLLLDCARDNPEDLAYLADYHRRLGTSAGDYVTVPGANHYLNSGRMYGLDYYDRVAVRFAADTIANWIAAPRP